MHGTIPFVGVSLNGTSLAALDPAAQTYIAALNTAGYTPNATITTAINTFFVGLKAAGLYTKTYVMYPFIGGAAAPHAINAKTPGTKNITWNGSVGHSSSGVKSNDASTGYGATGIIPTSELGAAVGLGYYVDTISTGTSIGSRVTALDTAFYIFRNGTDFFGCLAGFTRWTQVSGTFKGLLSASATQGNLGAAYVSGVNVGPIGLGNGLPTGEFLVCAITSNGTVTYTGTDLIKFCAIFSADLSAGEHLAYFNLVDALEVALGRQAV